MPKSAWFAAFAILCGSVVITGMAGCRAGAVAESEAENSPAQPPSRDSGPVAPSADAGQGNAFSRSADRELVLAGGCFWCMEIAFEQLRGVKDVVSGYAGGTAKDADYRTVSAGLTRHAEAIRIRYDPQVISEETLLKIFFTAAHDPTQVNRQGPDVGSQYRSAVFYTDDAQKQRVEAMIAQLEAAAEFQKKVATTLEPLEGFYPAEDYHQDFALLNPDQPYVVAHSKPKAARVCTAFPELIRQMQDIQNATDGTGAGEHEGIGQAGTSDPVAP